MSSQLAFVMKLQTQNSTTLEPPDLGMEILRISVKVPMIICEDVAPPQENQESDGTEAGNDMTPPISPRAMSFLTVPSVDPSVERRPCEFNNNTVNA